MLRHITPKAYVKPFHSNECLFLPLYTAQSCFQYLWKWISILPIIVFPTDLGTPHQKICQTGFPWQPVIFSLEVRNEVMKDHQ